MTDERKLLLLGLLRQTEMHGYLLNEHLDGFAPLTLKRPTAYNLLDRMEQEQWVVGRDEATGARGRKVYSITPKGEEEFLRLMREQLSNYSPNESPAMVSVGFLDALSKSEALSLLDLRRKAAMSFRRALGESSDDPHGHAGSGYLPIEYARRLADLDIGFLEEIVAQLRGGRMEQHE
jgi:DNA-binding PadR family transcriptional regulator